MLTVLAMNLPDTKVGHFPTGYVTTVRLAALISWNLNMEAKFAVANRREFLFLIDNCY